MTMLYVVIVETGEYSDRCDWVGGIFDDKETAQRMIVEKSAAAREFQLRQDEWDIKCRAVWKRFPYNWSYTAGTESNPERNAAIEREVGPRPEGQGGDRFYLIEVPLNQWGEFSLFEGE